MKPQPRPTRNFYLPLDLEYSELGWAGLGGGEA